MTDTKYTLNEKVIDATLEEYNRSLEFKTRIESKATGYITVLTLVLSVVIAILAIILNEKSSDYLGVWEKAAIMFSIPVIYFSLVDFCLCLYILKPREIHYFNSEDLEEILFDKPEDAHGSLFSSAKEYTKKNSEILKEMDFYNGLVYTLLVITIICFICYFFVAIFILIVGG